MTNSTDPIFLALQAARDAHWVASDTARECDNLLEADLQFNLASGITEAIQIYINTKAY